MPDSQDKQAIPLIYTNSVSVGLSLTDVNLTTHVNGTPQSIIVMPLPAAKSLIIALQQAVDDYERLTSTKVLDLTELNKILKG